MDFISYMIENMSYHDLFTYLCRAALWGITNLAKIVCNAVESLFEKIFNMISFFYSSDLLGYIQEHFLPLIVILLAISIIMLGYNLITKSDDSDRKSVVGAFTQNFLLFLIIMFFIPLLLTGQSPLGSSYSLSSISIEKPGEVKYSNDGSNVPINGDAKKDLDNGLIRILQSDALDVLKYKDDKSTAESIISKHLTDWLWVYTQIDTNTGKYANKKLTTINAGEAIKGVSEKHEPMKDITNLSINDRIVPDDNEAKENNGTEFEEIKWDIIGTAEDEEITCDEVNNRLTKTKTITSKIDVDGDEKDIKYAIEDTTFTEYIFGYRHNAIENGNSYIYSNSDCDTGVFGIDWLGAYPYRYTVDWLPMLIELVATIIVYFCLSFKTATLIWELAVNHILLYLFAAGDLTGGRKVREILKSMFSIIATILFAYVDLQVFLISCNFLNSLSNNLTTLQCALIKIFFAYACIDGPQILERIFGIDAGLKRPAAALLGALHTGIHTAKGAVKSTGKVVGGASKKAVAVGGYMAGKNEARRELERKANGGLIGGTEQNKNDKANKEQEKLAKKDAPFAVSDTNDNNENTIAKTENESNTTPSSIGGTDNSSSISDTNSSKENEGNKSSEQNNDSAYRDSIMKQCQNDLGMSEEEAEKVADAMENRRQNPDSSTGIEDISKLIGDHVDLDTATGLEKNGGLGLSQEEALGMKDKSADLGSQYMDKMDAKASKEQAKADFNSVGSRAATAELSSQKNTRSEALGGNTVSNSNVLQRSPRATHGAGISSIFTPKIAKTARSAREAGYNSVMYKNSDEYAHKKAERHSYNNKKHSYDDEELQNLYNNEDDEQ